MADLERTPADHSGAGQSRTGHSGIDHSGIDHSGTDHSGTDHSGIDHSGIDHGGIDHGGTRRSRTGHRPTGRGLERRRAIIEAAAELFARHGYPGVGMNDIGAAAGVTGPAIYRHFDSKAAVLAAVIDGIIDAVDDAGVLGTAGASATGAACQVHAGGPGSVGAAGADVAGANGVASAPAPPALLRSARPCEHPDPAAVLAGHVARYATGVAQRRELMAVFVREVHHLPAEHAQRLRHRQRDLVARWRALLAAAHPDWPDERVRTGVHAVFGMLNAVGTFSSPLADGELADHLTELALAAIGLPGSGARAMDSRTAQGSRTGHDSRTAQDRLHSER